MSQKMVAITGASRGIGLELTRKFLDMGWNVHVLVRRFSDELRELYRNPKLSFTLCDLENPEAIDRHSLPFLDVLINNAAAVDWQPHVDSVKTLHMSRGLLEKVYAVNVFAPLLLAQRFVLNPDARIVNVVSSVAECTHPDMQTDFQAAYTSSKAALLVLTKKMAAAFGPRGVVVNAACPGWVKTRMGGKDAPLSTSQGADNIIAACQLNSDRPVTGRYFKEGKLAKYISESL